MQTISKELTSSATWVQELSEFHDSDLASFSLDPEINDAVYTIIEELVSNYFKYEVDASGKGSIKISLSQTYDGLAISLNYKGKDFNPFKYPYLGEESAEKARVGGKGLEMVRKLADSYHYARNGAEITLNLFKIFPEVEMQINVKFENKIAIISLEGRLDILTSEELQKTLDSLIDEQHYHHIIIECSNLSFISSAGLRLFMLALKKLNKVGGKIAFCAFNANNRKIFDITGYDKFFVIYDSLDSAINAFK